MTPDDTTEEPMQYITERVVVLEQALDKSESEVTRLKAELHAIPTAVRILCEANEGAALSEVCEDYPEIAKSIRGLKAELAQANTIAGDAKFQNERLVARVQQLEAQLESAREALGETLRQMAQWKALGASRETKQ